MPELPEVEVVRRGLASHVVGRTFEAVHITGERAARRYPHGRDHLAELLTGRRVLAADRRGKYLWLVLDGAGGGARTGGAAGAGGVRHSGAAGEASHSPETAEAPDGRETGAAGEASHSPETWETGKTGGASHHSPETDEAGPEPSAPFALVVHLGMSGQMLVEAADAPLERHAHAVFWLGEPEPPRDGASPTREGTASEPARHLRFVDQRTFGGLAVSPLTAPVPGHAHGVPTSIAHIAPDPLEQAFDEAATVRRIRASASGVKRSLLNQNLVSGIGNIYADESLWRAGIHGERPGSALSKPAVTRLLTHARDVMEESLHQGGTSFDSLYVNVNGASGYFSRSLDVYGREGLPCNRCGRPIRRESFMNRSSFSCPACQVRPRSAARPSPAARPSVSTPPSSAAGRASR